MPPVSVTDQETDRASSPCCPTTSGRYERGRLVFWRFALAPQAQKKASTKKRRPRAPLKFGGETSRE
jgi:hypothetical protein